MSTLDILIGREHQIFDCLLVYFTINRCGLVWGCVCTTFERLSANVTEENMRLPCSDALSSAGGFGGADCSRTPSSAGEFGGTDCSRESSSAGESGGNTNWLSETVVHR